LVLLWLQARVLRRALAELQKATQFIAEIRKRVQQAAGIV
jgi:hypothetical protein